MGMPRESRSKQERDRCGLHVGGRPRPPPHTARLLLSVQVWFNILCLGVTCRDPTDRPPGAGFRVSTATGCQAGAGQRGPVRWETLPRGRRTGRATARTRPSGELAPFPGARADWRAIGRGLGQATCALRLELAASPRRLGCVSDSKPRGGPGRGAALPSCEADLTPERGATLPLPEQWPSRPGNPFCK